LIAVKKKIVLLGDSAVGKTSLIRRYVFDQFKDSYIATIGSKVSRKELMIKRPDGTHSLTFMIWDIIGREGYVGLHSKTYAGVHGAILVADLTRKETLENLERHWIPHLFKVVEKVPLIFACNKSDLVGEVEFDPQELADMARKYQGSVDEILPSGFDSNYYTSAKNGSNVENVFNSLGHLLLGSTEIEDPIKELYENLVALGIHRSTDKTNAIGAMDAIIVDFCEGFEDPKLPMMILRQELTRAGIHIHDPTKKGILKAVEYLAEAECEFIDEDIVIANLKKRLEWANMIKE
jgi:small GTP-binding protein